MSKAPEVMAQINSHVATMNAENEYTQKVISLIQEGKDEGFSDEVTLKVLMLESIKQEQTIAMLDLLSSMLPDDNEKKPVYREAVEYDNFIRKMSHSLSDDEKNEIDQIVRLELSHLDKENI